MRGQSTVVANRTRLARSWAVRPLLCLCLAACGRIGFAGHAAPARLDAAIDAPPDAPLCVTGDGLCPPGCTAATDGDCPAACGDGTCSGNSGETCRSCMADCDTMAAVCGNGICDPGETSATCPPDCGPSPWPFGQMEMDFLTAVNQARTTGVTCPGDSMVTTAPALTLDPAPPTSARLLAWNLAALDTLLPAPTTCNGASVGSFATTAGYSAYVLGTGYPTAQDAVNGFVTSSNTCPIIMSRSVAMIGVAQGASVGWVIFLR
jgi:hypothetical protein